MASFRCSQDHDHCHMIGQAIFLAKVIQRALKLLPVLVLAWHEMVRPWEMACWEWEQHLGLWRFFVERIGFCQLTVSLSEEFPLGILSLN